MIGKQKLVLLTLILYLALSIVLGMIAVWVGYRLAR